MERGGREARPVLDWTGRLGRYPAAAALFAFVALELAHPRPAYPRTLGIAIALYTYWALAGMAVYGRDPWTRYGEGFAVAFGLLARIAPFAVRDGSVVVRWPFTGLAGDDRIRGTLLFVAVLLGSTSFDGFCSLQYLARPARRAARGARRLVAADRRPRDDVPQPRGARLLRGGDPRDLPRGGRGGGEARPQSIGRSSPTSSFRSSPSPPRISRLTTSRCS